MQYWQHGIEQLRSRQQRSSALWYRRRGRKLWDGQHSYLIDSRFHSISMLFLPLADGANWVFKNSQNKANPALDLLSAALNLNHAEEHACLRMIVKTDEPLLHVITIRYSHRPANAIQPPAPRGRRFTWRIGTSRHPRLHFVNAFRISQFVGMNAERRGGILLHGALLEKEGKGVILAGPSGAGKSTAGRRLNHPWRSLSDDMVLVVKKNKGEYRAHPWPTWSRMEMRDPSGRVDAAYSVPLSGIFFIQQSQDDSATPSEKSNSIGMLLGCAEIATGSMVHLLPQKEVVTIRKRRFHNMFDLTSSIPQYRLSVSLKGRFWEKIEEVHAS